MRTLRAERHIERVEWVTDQVRWRKESGGKGIVCGGDWEEWEESREYL